jgi:hypothetical protein
MPARVFACCAASPESGAPDAAADPDEGGTVICGIVTPALDRAVASLDLLFFEDGVILFPFLGRKGSLPVRS